MLRYRVTQVSLIIQYGVRTQFVRLLWPSKGGPQAARSSKPGAATVNGDHFDCILRGQSTHDDTVSTCHERSRWRSPKTNLYTYHLELAIAPRGSPAPPTRLLSGRRHHALFVTICDHKFRRRRATRPYHDPLSAVPSSPILTSRGSLALA